MKAIKLSQEEKKEAKQAAKSFNALIRQAKKKGALVEIINPFKKIIHYEKMV